jgi:acetylornithine deacetylase/succinyl-diaminopimelate desuccinylase-like protein
MKTMDPQLAARLIHSANERIEIADLELAVDCLRHVAVEVTGGG